MPQTFFAFWEQCHEDVPPIGWKLKHGLPERWLRIHTLPGSKRYADTAPEAAEIAERQVTAAQAVFEEDALLWLVTWHYHPPPGVIEIVEASEGIGVPLVEAGVLAGDEEDATIAVLVAHLRWSAHDSAALRRAIADDEKRAMWVHARTGEVFAPYDGGVDLIFASSERRDQYKRRFSAWRSAHEDGF